MLMRVIALSAVLVLTPAAWAMAAPHAGGGHAEGVADSGDEHWGDRHRPEGHWRTDDHRDSPAYGSYGDPAYPYADPAAPPYWYDCGAGAYYPYVAECPEGWQPVVP